MAENKRLSDLKDKTSGTNLKEGSKIKAGLMVHSKAGQCDDTLVIQRRKEQNEVKGLSKVSIIHLYEHIFQQKWCDSKLIVNQGNFQINRNRKNSIIIFLLIWHTREILRIYKMKADSKQHVNHQKNISEISYKNYDVKINLLP